jgi:hypothetical protein
VIYRRTVGFKREFRNLSSEIKRAARAKFATVFAAIKQLIAPTEPAKKRIGFHPDL